MQSVKSVKTCLQMLSVKNVFSLQMQYVTDSSFLLIQYSKNPYSLLRILMSHSDYQNIQILEGNKKGNFTSSYSPICSQLCSCDKPVLHITKELYFGHISSIYHLYSIVYYGDNHYTSCVISEDNSVWYHDGIQTGSSMILQGDKSYYKSNKWNMYNNKNAVLFVYICF